MTVPEFDPARSDAIRDALIRRASQSPRPGGISRWIARLGIGVVGVLAGAAITSGAWASGWIDRPDLDLDQPGSSLVGADGVIPGAPQVTLLGDPVTQTVDGTAAIELGERPQDATHIRLRIACLAAGTVGFGFDPSNTPSMSCAPADVGDVAWLDLELPDDPILHIIAEPGMRTVVDYEFAIVRGTEWATNATGDTYGTSNGAGSPVLVAVIGWDDEGNMVEGYAYDEQIAHAGYPAPQNPDEAGEYMEYVAELREQYPDGFPVPVYESDGVTQIGWFYVSLGE